MFIKHINFIADLKGNKLPVIIGAPPPPEVREKRGRRMFLNGTIDYKGPLRTAPSKRQLPDTDPPCSATVDDDENNEDDDDDEDDDNDDDDQPLVPPQRKTRSSGPAVPSTTITVAIPPKPAVKKLSAVKTSTMKKNRPIILSDDDVSPAARDNHRRHGSVSGSEHDDPHPGVKRKPERRDSGGAKKKVHILVSGSEDDKEGDVSGVGDGDHEPGKRTRGRNPKSKPVRAKPTKSTGTSRQDGNQDKDHTSTVNSNVVNLQPTSGAVGASNLVQDGDPFIGELFRMLEIC
jgi:hypothetical protein